MTDVAKVQKAISCPKKRIRCEKKRCGMYPLYTHNGAMMDYPSTCSIGIRGIASNGIIALINPT